MNVYTQDRDIRKALAKVKPTHIAVAYIGAKWTNYVDPKPLKKVLLSPTLGSNPNAIAELAKVIGWENVEFLDDLHSKFYIGAKSALLGSCNLSQNAIGDGGKYEAAVVTEDLQHLALLHRQFEAYLEQARLDYPDQASKITQLQRLRAQTELARSMGLDKRSAKKPKTALFEAIPGQRIHMSWWTDGDTDDGWCDPKAVVRARKDMRGRNLDEHYSDCMHCHRDDKVRERDWILTWKASSRTGKALGKLDWVYVSDFIPNATGDVDYPHLAVEVEGEKPEREPFDLKTHGKLVLELLQSNDERFQCLRATPDLLDWRMPDPNTTVQEFMEALKQRYASKMRKKTTADSASLSGRKAEKAVA